MNESLPLAYSMASNPGVYAVLLGSGVSRSSGIKTGWEIVLDMCNTIAHTEGEYPGEDIVAWYQAKYSRQPRYDELLDRLSKTSNERQGILKKYFEPSDDDIDQGIKLPTDSHRGIAKLVKNGLIRMIITTNFDHLMENALREEGVTFNVAYSPDMLEGLPPYVHSTCTLIKLHGDYLDTRLLNTEEELSKYDHRVESFLNRVLDEFGLIIAGWSGVWDKALRTAMLQCKSLRYAWYWLSVGEVQQEAQEIINHRHADVIKIISADSFFPKLAEQVAAIQELNKPRPLNVQVAIAMVKRFLSARKDIELEDMFVSETISLKKEFEEYDYDSSIGEDRVLQRFNMYIERTRILLGMIGAIAYYDKENRYQELLKQTVKRLIPQRDAGKQLYLELSKLPVLLTLYTIGILAVSRNNLQLLKAVFCDIEVSTFHGKQPIIRKYDPSDVFTEIRNRKYPQLSEYIQVFSMTMYQIMHPVIEPYLPTIQEYQETYYKYELIFGLLVLGDTGENVIVPKFCIDREGRKEIDDFLRAGRIQQENWPICQVFYNGELSRFLNSLQRYSNRISRLYEYNIWPFNMVEIWEGKETSPYY